MRGVATGMYRSLTSQLHVAPFCSSAQRSSSHRPPPHRILFFGSDSFAFPVLKKLNELRKSNPEIIEFLKVVTHVKTSKSKKSVNAVEKFAIDEGISKMEVMDLYAVCFNNCFKAYVTPIGNTPNDRKNEWKAFNESELFEDEKVVYDLGIVCSYGYMIPSFIIDRFRTGMVVVHPSLLPKYRGASPLQYALLNGDTETGTSIIEISKNSFDAGNILKQSKCSIRSDLIYTELNSMLAELSADDVVDVVKNFQTLKAGGLQQDESQYTSAPKFTGNDVFLRFATETAEQTFNRYRAFKGTNFVSVRSHFRGKEVILDEISLPNSQNEANQLALLTNAKPGSVWCFKQKSMKNFFYVKCADKFIRVVMWRFADQQPRPAYTFADQFLDKNALAENLQHEGFAFFEENNQMNKEHTKK